ncbi:hypothetical protein PVAP13_1NG067701 [Panicum virgatum]|uniref:Uncharacterized protein n=1 Tax=Panicum virgatum TaxID=38727 RepID=A0A8T0WIV7_PANVG|nr:hypothetical protein PVAP13_1NG067701 [Panicum virgatum]
MLDALLGRDKLTGKQAAQPSRRLAYPQLDGPRCPHRPPLFDRAASTSGTPACIGPARRSACCHSPASVCGSPASPPPCPCQLLLAGRAASPPFAVARPPPCLAGLAASTPAPTAARWPCCHLQPYASFACHSNHSGAPPPPAAAIVRAATAPVQRASARFPRLQILRSA